MTMPRHVFLLTIDALRADHLSSVGYERETTPNLDVFAAEYCQFTDAFSASSHTREAVPALLTGRYPLDAVDDKYALAENTIATHLKNAGFATGGFHSNPFVSRAYGFDRGFDVFDDDLHLGKHKLLALAQRAFDKLRSRHYARAETINERSLAWLDTLDDGPVFLWNHYMDVHGPYEPPDKYRRLFHDESVSDSAAQRLYQRAISDPQSITEEERRRLIDLYDAEIRYVDAQIASFLDALDDRGLLAESLVVITSDHGDAFGEHGYYEHPRYLHDELLHVPLLVASPEATGGVIETPVSTLDIVPTILSACGIDAGTLAGEPLQKTWTDPQEDEDRIVFSQARGEGEDGSMRRFCARNTAGWYVLERDIETGELRNEGGMDEVTLAEALRSHSEQQTQSRSAWSSSPDEQSEEIERRLEALGYK